MTTVSDNLKSFEIQIPTNNTEAMNSPQANFWQAAMENQLKKLHIAKAYDLVPKPPPGTQILPGKWVYDTKVDQNSIITEFRARWVVCGNFQRPGYELNEKYAPVATPQAVNLFLTFAAISGWPIVQRDVVSAYLNAALGNRSVYMVQPKGFEQTDTNDRPLVCQLLQALYGLRQSAYLWHDTFTKQLKNAGFVVCDDDTCLFRKILPDKTIIFILIYVDDILATAPTTALILDFFDNLTFKLKNLQFDRFLGCSINRCEDVIAVNQKPYILDVLESTAMTNATPSPTPMTTNYKTPPSSEHEAKADDEGNTGYASGGTMGFATDVGKLAWIASKSRPDISLAVNKLQRQTSNPRDCDFHAVKRVLRYLRGTLDLGIVFGSDPSQGLIGFVDASHADIEDSKSTEAYVFFMAGGPISWASKRQHAVATSTTVAEYYAMDCAVREALFLAKLASQFGMHKPSDPVIIYTDSDNALKLLSQKGYSPTTRWMATRYHFVKQAIQDGLIQFILIPSKLNCADGLTKALQGDAFDNFRDNQLGLSNIDP
jgi:hypothetical protein